VGAVPRDAVNGRFYLQGWGAHILVGPRDTAAFLAGAPGHKGAALYTAAAFHKDWNVLAPPVTCHAATLSAPAVDAPDERWVHGRSPAASRVRATGRYGIPGECCRDATLAKVVLVTWILM